MATLKNEIFGKFTRGGLSSRIKFIDYLKESDGGSSFTALDVSGEHGAHGNTVDYPASASSIARAFKLSPATVQEVLDKMTRMGTITRVGDAYSYGSTEVPNA